MLKQLKALIEGAAPAGEDSDCDLDLAFAAMLVEAARIDESYDDVERTRIDQILAEEFELDAEGAAKLRGRAELAQAEANDLYKFSKVVKEALSHDEKIAFVERLWEVAYADGDRDSYEDYLVRRLLGLIHVSDRESGEARRRAQARVAGG